MITWPCHMPYATYPPSLKHLVCESRCQFADWKFIIIELGLASVYGPQRIETRPLFGQVQFCGSLATEILRVQFGDFKCLKWLLVVGFQLSWMRFTGKPNSHAPYFPSKPNAFDLLNYENACQQLNCEDELIDGAAFNSICHLVVLPSYLFL